MNRQTVLVVDDDPRSAHLLRLLLEPRGYRVTEVADGRETQAAVERERPAVVVLDLMMPEVDGVEVLRRRQQEGLAQDTRVLILTAKLDTQDAVWCWELGADEYITKPVDPDQLLRYGLALLKRTPDELYHHREVGLREARRLDGLEDAFRPSRPAADDA